MIISRGSIVDVLFADDECLVLTSAECLRLTAVPSGILEFLEEPRGEEDVRVHLEERFGPAPAGRLSEVLDELHSHGVVHIASEIAPSDES